ncbi:(2Fe-2S) ferredoxin domain-containing protein [Gordonia shandongensis]|uniref:(2Fe-2S) ferredoxin domain-containing protein n=1 Tax=Gordonia shandongensis TaxID=376351 RepID=UPI000479F192|nr:(2Fe-2S) ferredoxin domain-containing protein [Gordonia shandongensis]
MSDIDWVILTAPTNRGADPAAELSAAVAALEKRRRDVRVRVAVLGGGAPTITDALDEAADSGARRVMVLSGQTVADRSMDAWFRRVIGHWLRGRPADVDDPEVVIGPSLCDTEAYADLVDRAVAEGGVPARSTTAPLVSPAWESVPGFTRHVLICRGPRCAARGSGETAEALKRELIREELGDDDVLVTHTGCMFPCVQAPVVAVYPDDVWYAGLDADRVPEMVRHHLRDGEPVTRWLGRRTPR